MHHIGASGAAANKGKRHKGRGGQYGGEGLRVREGLSRGGGEILKMPG